MKIAISKQTVKESLDSLEWEAFTMYKGDSQIYELTIEEMGRFNLFDKKGSSCG